jgi:hypothetical protein
MTWLMIHSNVSARWTKCIREYEPESGSPLIGVTVPSPSKIQQNSRTFIIFFRIGIVSPSVRILHGPSRYKADVVEEMDDLVNDLLQYQCSNSLGSMSLKVVHL